MRKLVSIVLALLGASYSVVAATTGDDFSDNSKDTSKWGADELFGNGRLFEANQRLEYRCSTGTADDDDIRPWIGNAGPYNADWEMQLDLNNTTTLTLDNQVNSYGLKIRSPLTTGREIIVELYNSSLGGLPSRRGFNGEIQENDTYLTSGDTGEAGVTAGAVRLTFNSTTKVFTCYYATNSHDWIELASFGVAGAGGATTNSDWGLSDTDTFPIYLYGYSADTTVPTGQMYGDDFSITGGVGGGGGGGTEHNFAVLSLKAPKNINLKAAGPALTKRVKVQIQNLSDHSETISSLAMLADLVKVTVESLGTNCVAPAAELIMGSPNKPRTLKAKGKLNVFFDVSYGCANDPFKGAGHEDYRYTTVVNHAALDGQADVEPENDVCPRAASGSDKGCGNKNTDGSLGADVKTDMVLK